MLKVAVFFFEIESVVQRHAPLILLECALVLQDRVRGAEPGVGGRVLPGGQAGAEGGEDWLSKQKNNEGEIKCAMGKMNVHELSYSEHFLSRLHVEMEAKQKKEQQQKELLYCHDCCPFDRIFELHIIFARLVHYVHSKGSCTP